MMLTLCYLSFIGAAMAEDMPSFSLKSKGGGEVSLSSFKGKVVLVDFWASWCVPCRASFPVYNDLYNKYKGQGFEILAVNTEDDSSGVDSFLKDYPADFPVLLGGKQLASQMNISQMPTSILISRNGAIIKKHGGFQENMRADLEDSIKQALGGN